MKLKKVKKLAIAAAKQAAAEEPGCGCEAKFFCNQCHAEVGSAAYIAAEEVFKSFGVSDAKITGRAAFKAYLASWVNKDPRPSWHPFHDPHGRVKSIG